MTCENTAQLLGGPFAGVTVRCTLPEGHAEQDLMLDHRGPVPGAAPGVEFLWPVAGDGPPTLTEP